MKTLLIFLMMVGSFAAMAQSDKEKAHALGREAIAKMDAGQIDVAINLLKEAQKLDPKRMDLSYEMGYAQLLKKDYKAATKTFKKLLKHKDVNSQVYQMLGNTYSMSGNPDLAIKTYEKGLKVFPNAGNLYLERGNMELANKAYNEAVVYYEKGIEMQPEFASNYYWAARIFLGTENEVWGMIYGEIFMNLERNSIRTQEISKLLFDIYKSQIQFPTDTTASVSFASNTIVVTDLASLENFKMPYGLLVYEPLLSLAIISQKEINLASLATIRANFANSYALGDHKETYPNRLFDYHKEMIELGHFEAYSYWVLQKGDEEAFSKWQAEHQVAWKAFVAWFTANPIGINAENKFYRNGY